MGKVTGKPYAWYLQELGQHEDDLLDLKGDILDPIRRFMGGTQKAIYDEAKAYLTEQSANFVYGGDDKADAIRNVLDNPQCFKSNAIQQMKATLDALKQEVRAKVEAERKTAVSNVEDLRNKLQSLPEFAKTTDSTRQKIEAEFAGVLRAIAESSLIAVIRESVNRFKSVSYPALLNRITTPAPKPTPEIVGVGAEPKGFNDGAPPPVAPAPIEYVSASTLRGTYPKAYLADAQDVDAYLANLRQRLMAEIHAGKRITI